MPAPIRSKATSAKRSPLVWWYGPVAAAGFAFGLIGERRPFGESLFAHPLYLYFIVVALALLTLRLVLRRPVPQLIPERALIVGCFAGVGAFLAGNFIAAYVLGH